MNLTTAISDVPFAGIREILTNFLTNFSNKWFVRGALHDN